MLKNRFYLLFIFVLSSSVFCQTTQWTVSWDLNDEGDMSHYLIFRGTDPSTPDQVGNVAHPENNFIDTPPEKATLYYYRAKAVDFSGNESEFSKTDSAAIPSIDFSSLQNQIIGPGQTITIDNLNSYVDDPDDENFDWSYDAPSIQVQFNNNRAIISAPSTFNNIQIVEFTATDSDGFYDIATITFTVDSSFIIPENGKSVFAYPVPLNLADDPNATITFQNVPDNATVLIYNMMGELVFKIENAPFEWDIKNEAGKAIYPGVYLYYIKSGDKKRTGKLVIVK